MAKTVIEINQKIKRKQAVVVTAEEMCSLVDDNGVEEAAKEVDVVTTGTFGPMCSSGAYFNIAQPKPKIKLGGGVCYLNDVPAYPGFAAADIFLGCSQVMRDDPKNKIHPGEFRYGGAHVIEDFVSGKNIKLEAYAYGTDCYPRREYETIINVKNVNDAVLFNPRNAYQNYNVAVNRTHKNIYTYMGMLKAKMNNATYCSAGQLSPLLNDPLYQTIGIGTRIFLGGSYGYITWPGTQHNPKAPRKNNKVPFLPAGTLAVIGDLKKMNPSWLVGLSMAGYGVTLMVGIGIPIPILNEQMARFTAVKDKDIYAPIIDYGKDYPQGKNKILGKVSYAELKSGEITLNKKKIKTASLSSYSKAVEIAETLKKWISKGEFLLTNPVARISGSGKE
ncbi:MAG: homocysteine biosynthesis protein [bacterium]